MRALQNYIPWDNRVYPETSLQSLAANIRSIRAHCQFKCQAHSGNSKYTATPTSTKMPLNYPSKPLIPNLILVQCQCTAVHNNTIQGVQIVGIVGRDNSGHRAAIKAESWTIDTPLHSPRPLKNAFQHTLIIWPVQNTTSGGGGGGGGVRERRCHTIC